jgi:hypothetical protein
MVSYRNQQVYLEDAVAEILSITTMSVNLDDLQMQARAKDWEVMRDERDMARDNYDNLLVDTRGEIAGLRAELAKLRKEIANAKS